MNQNIKNILENITSLPGIYKFEDKALKYYIYRQGLESKKKSFIIL
jgi:hypothetical protein